MYPRLRLPFIAVLLLVSKMALAADPVGSWTVDTAALRGEFERLMRADIAKMPAAQRAQTEAVLSGRLDEMVHRSAGKAEFRPDGTVLLEDCVGQRRTGRWTLEDDRIYLMSENQPSYVGTFEGGIMCLEASGEAEPVPALVLTRQ